MLREKISIALNKKVDSYKAKKMKKVIDPSTLVLKCSTM